jgi:hypothetical protein
VWWSASLPGDLAWVAPERTRGCCRIACTVCHYSRSEQGSTHMARRYTSRLAMPWVVIDPSPLCYVQQSVHSCGEEHAGIWDLARDTG